MFEVGWGVSRPTSHGRVESESRLWEPPVMCIGTISTLSTIGLHGRVPAVSRNSKHAVSAATCRLPKGRSNRHAISPAPLRLMPMECLLSDEPFTIPFEQREDLRDARV